MLSLQTKRHIIMRYVFLFALTEVQFDQNILNSVMLFSLNEQRQVCHKQTTDIVPLSLDKNQEIPLLYLDNALEYPLLLSLNILLVTPSSIDSSGPQETDTKAASISNIGSKVVCSSDLIYAWYRSTSRRAVN